VDPLLASGKPELLQSRNRYSYCVNNPLMFVDPEGLVWGYKYDAEKRTTTYEWFDGDEVGEDIKNLKPIMSRVIMKENWLGLTFNPLSYCSKNGTQ